ncbi:unnamed protein product [Phytomonas sp. Hart1]|nr:unnamed protein product [Phytomonas sp. Hart1]|eukprot:CCW67985.1 unnamed protein product [Phytomonas sp. isolate Hart1]
MLFLRKSTIFPCFKRQIIVGPSKGIPTISNVPRFGKHLTSSSREEQTTIEPDVGSELRAQAACKDSYGFLRKPLLMKSWTEFQKELQRIEFQWYLAPESGGIITLKVFDHSEPGNGFLCELKGNGSKCTPIADFFECCGSILTGNSESHTIYFINDTSEFLLLVNSERFINSHDRIKSEDLAKKEELMHTIGLGTMVNLLIIDKKTNLRTPLFNKISLLTLNYAFLTSIPIFLKRNDVGVRNVDFVSKNQIHHFRFAWCFIRSRSSMTPIDITELDCLLPI